MTVDDIVRMVPDGESEILEFKATTGERTEAAKSVCAMLNQRGGIVLIGVKRDGTITGQQVSDGTLERLGHEIALIEPPYFPSMERVPVGSRREVVVIRVSRGAMRPYRYRNNAYLRVGNTNRRMTAHQIEQMFLERVHAHQRWENEPAVGWKINDLDSREILHTAEVSIRQNRLPATAPSSLGELLQGLGLMKDGILLRAAVALFGNDQRIGSEMPQCLLRLARFRGTNVTADFIDNRQFRGNAFTLMGYAERFLTESIPVAGRIRPGSLVREDEPLYPILALREALANAFCHRDYTSGGGSVGISIYDDRLEVTSVGPLHFGLTPEQLFRMHISQPWNPLIADVFYRRGIIERWGVGIAKMVELMEQAGRPRPEIEDNGDSVTVRFRPSQYLAPQRVEHDLTERQRAILTLVHEAGAGLALSEINYRLAVKATRRQIQLDLSALRMLNLVVSTGRGPGARWHFST